MLKALLVPWPVICLEAVAVEYEKPCLDMLVEVVDEDTLLLKEVF
jgi:hypothetical protein|tara:strand:- start:261 stop:395 length:135 start_codon:yes stop_codon:yes gene_type:complete